MASLFSKMSSKVNLLPSESGASTDAGYMNNGMMTMPAMALILLGCVIWVHRAYFYKEK